MTTINVTSDDIAEGQGLSQCYCPIALAMKRAGYQSPMVGSGQVSFLSRRDRRLLVCPLPPEASDFIRNFDYCGTSGVAPFSFEFPSP